MVIRVVTRSYVEQPTRSYVLDIVSSWARRRSPSMAQREFPLQNSRIFSSIVIGFWGFWRVFGISWRFGNSFLAEFSVIFWLKGSSVRLRSNWFWRIEAGEFESLSVWTLENMGTGDLKFWKFKNLKISAVDNFESTRCASFEIFESRTIDNLRI